MTFGWPIFGSQLEGRDGILPLVQDTIVSEL